MSGRRDVKRGLGKDGPSRDRAYWDPPRSGFGRLEARIEEITPAEESAPAVSTSRPRRLLGKGSRPALSAAIGGCVLLTVIVVASWPSSHPTASQPPSPVATPSASPSPLSSDVAVVATASGGDMPSPSVGPTEAWTLWPDGYVPTFEPATPSPQPTPTSTPIVFATDTPEPQPSYPTISSKSWPVKIDLTTINVLIQSAVSMGPDGTTYVGGQPALDGSGKTRAGWLKLPDGSYGTPVLFGPDGTIYIRVDLPDSTDVNLPLRSSLYAFDARGRAKSGWPVSLGYDPDFKLLASGNVAVLASRNDEAGDRITILTPGGKANASWGVPRRNGGYFCGWLVRPDGSMFFSFSTTYRACSITVYSAAGKTLSASNPREWNSMSVSPQGQVVAVGYDMEPYSSAVIARTRIAVLGTDGRPIAGCPLVLEGAASKPAFGPDGTMYLARAGLGTAPSTLLAYGQDCRPKTEWAPSYPSGYGPFTSGDFPTPQPPVVTPGGAVLTLAIDASRMGYVLGFDAGGQAIPGWPYKLPQPLAQFDAGGFTINQPNLNIGLLLPQTASGPVAAYLALEDQLVGIGADGHAAAGWPVSIPADSTSADNWETLLTTPDGGVLFVTLNPRTSLATIIRLTQAGTVAH